MPFALPPLAHRRGLLLAVVGLGLGVMGFALFAGRVAALRSGHATGPNWKFPSLVYSDDVVLVPGRILPAEYLLAQLEARDYHEVPGHPLGPGTFARLGETFEIALRGFSEAPDPLRNCDPETVRLRIHEGRLTTVQQMGGVREPRGSHAPEGKRAARRAATSALPPRLEPVLIALLFDQDLTWRTWVDLDRVPEAVSDAIVASEDRRFRSHIGVDVRGYLRALRANVRAGGLREGGSTITQQLARSLFLGRQRTLGRKLAEVPLALGLEAALGKRRILEMYLNSIYWGQAGSYSIGGIAAATRWYFHAPIESLGALEGATLAAMIPAPNVFDPFDRPQLVRARRNRVLQEMVAVHRLTAARAMVGGRAFEPGAFNRAYQARRQTGSAIKPIVYAAAFAAGRHFTPATVVPDVPRTFQTDRGPWTPHNDDGTFHSKVTLVKALERSLNVATTNVVDLVGPQQVARVAGRFGLGRLKPVMSIGLGTNEATLIDLTRAFAVFGDGGTLVPISAIRTVTD